MDIFNIRERELMNGKEINHVYRLLNTLDIKRRQIMDSSRTLNNL